MSISLEFMLKEFSRHASRDICRNQLEFSDYHLVYYMPIIYSANNLYSTICCIRVNCEFTLLIKNTYTVYNNNIILINVACIHVQVYLHTMSYRCRKQILIVGLKYFVLLYPLNHAIVYYVYIMTAHKVICKGMFVFYCIHSRFYNT